MSSEKQMVAKKGNASGLLLDLKQVTSLFSIFKSEIAQYYGQDAKFGNVQDFLKWLEKNDSMLVAQLQADLKSGSLSFSSMPSDKRKKSAAMNFTLGVWVGGKYLASRLEPVAKTIRYPPLLYAGQYEDLGTVPTEDKRLAIVLGGPVVAEFTAAAKTNALVLISAVNIGIHEHAHAFPYMTLADYSKNHSNEDISEIGAYYIQEKIGFPIRLNDGLLAGLANYYNIITDIIRRRDGAGAEFQVSQYLDSAILPWIKNRLNAGLDIRKFIRQFDYNDDTVFRLGDIAGMYGVKFNSKKFYSLAAITNAKLISDLNEVFGKVVKAKPESALEFLEVFTKEMSAKFGKPSGWDYPNTYGRLDNELSSPGANIALEEISDKDAQNYLAGLIPKRRSELK